MKKRIISNKAYILQNIKVDEATQCWLWQMSCRHGYGVLKVSGKMKCAHRISYEVFEGPIPKGMLVCHTCDNPKCVNPEHLWLGTQQDNMDDMYNKGRQGEWDHHIPHPNIDNKGSKNPNAKLTEEDVIEIRILLTAGELQRIIAEKFGVGQNTISQIKTGINWSHVSQ